MKIEPNAIILYVDDLAKSSYFYQDLLGINPVAASATFHSFTLSKGMTLGLKARYSVDPPIDEKGHTELAFTLDNDERVVALFDEWQRKGINIALPPTPVAYGYTFVATDPDGNRLRVVSLGGQTS